MLRMEVFDFYKISSLIRDFEIVKEQVGLSIFRSKAVKETDYSRLQKLVKYGIVRIIERRTEQRIIKPRRYYYNDYYDNMSLVDTITGRAVTDIDNTVEGHTYKAIKGKIIDGRYCTYQFEYPNTSLLIDAIKEKFMNDLNKLY